MKSSSNTPGSILSLDRRARTEKIERREREVKYYFVTLNDDDFKVNFKSFPNTKKI